MSDDDDASPEIIPGPRVPEGAVSKELLIINKRGLHARASAKFVQTVERFSAEVWVTRTSASKRSTVWTNLAEARACRPRLLQISTVRTTVPGRGSGVAGGSSVPRGSLICR